VEFIYVNKNNLKPVVDSFVTCCTFGLDTETTGLRFSDKLFSLQLCTGYKVYYFNFNNKKDVFGNFASSILNKYKVFDLLKPIFENPKNTFFAHNFLFDLNMLEKEGVKMLGDTFCTQAAVRVLNNDALSVSLKDSLHMYNIREKKMDEVEEFISKHKLYTYETVEGKTQRIKNKHFDRVDHNLMFEYGCQDALAVYKLGTHLKKVLENKPKTKRIVDNEHKLVTPLSSMRSYGIKGDIDYIKEAKEYTKKEIDKCFIEIKNIAGEEYQPGPIWLKKIFEKNKWDYEVTKKSGAIKKDKKALKKYANPLANKLLELNKLEKELGTYWSSFLYQKEGETLHCYINQSGTVTGRFSSNSPNLQNIPREGAGKYDPRKAFIQREGFKFVAIDYDQQEYRLMLDQAGAKGIIKSIVEEGLDVHTATAQMVGMERTPAKTLNFAILYGMGLDALAETLGVSVDEARKIRNNYFDKMPEVSQWMFDVKNAVLNQRFIRNWAGRPIQSPPSKFAYKVCNYLIQGGCADVIKIAMNRIHDFLKDYKSRMILQIHDEILFEIAEDEMHIVPNLKEIMEQVYKPKNGLYLNASVSISQAGSFSKSDLKDVTPLELKEWGN
jgi:DNA polymerase-1